MEVKMRLRRVARVADEAEDLPASHPVTRLHSERARAKVRIKRVATAADVEDYVVPAHSLEIDWHGARVDAGNILRDAIFCRDDDAVGDRDRVGVLRVEVFIARPIAAHRAPGCI